MEVYNIQFESLLFHTLVCKQILAIVIKKHENVKYIKIKKIKNGTGLKTDTDQWNRIKVPEINPQ